MAQKQTLTGFIVFLIIVLAAVFTYKFLSSQSMPNPSQTTNPPAQINPNTSQRDDLTADENFVLSNITKEKSSQEQKKFLEVLYLAATTSAQLEITDCKVKPAILKVQVNKPLVVKNNDSSSHTLTINEKRYQIAAGGNTTITTDFGEEDRIYPYTCDQTSLTGAMWTAK